jgi:biopolymer transport protein ExbD
MRKLVAVLVFMAFCAAAAEASDLCPAKIFVHANGIVDFNGIPFSDNKKLKLRLIEYKKSYPHCLPSVKGDKDTPFEAVGQVVFLLQQVGFMKVGYLTEPRN